MKNNKIFRSMLIIVLTYLLHYTGFSQVSAAGRLNHLNVKKELAIKGYDPVSYFLDSVPEKGIASIAYQHIDITYYFSSEENKKSFMANPVKYEPQYGGWCAYAMGDRGEKVEVNPETFKIVKGKLYLFYNRGKHNMLVNWNKDEASLIVKADDYWENIIHKVK